MTPLAIPRGDQLLVEVAQRLRSSVREGDIVARLGGDEFALLQPIGQGAREDSIALALRIIDVISEPFNLDGQQVNVGTSIGIAFSPDDGLTPDDLMKKADLALYSTKANGRNDFRVFRPDMIAAAQTQKTVEAELRDALANNEFELFYQPIFDTQTQRVCGAEALSSPTSSSRPPRRPDSSFPWANGSFSKPVVMQRPGRRISGCRSICRPSSLTKATCSTLYFARWWRLV